jgi:hypothetical protein
VPKLWQKESARRELLRLLRHGVGVA